MPGLFSEPACSGATVSRCGLYRYDLWRSWGPDGGEPADPANFVMLNPSTADASEDDPTIRRCIGFARAWGHDGLVVTNLFAFRATDPAVMRKQVDPFGPENDGYIARHATRARTVVAAWGNHGSLYGRAGIVLDMLAARGVRVMALRVTKAGQPEHPLYLPARLTPQPFRVP